MSGPELISWLAAECRFKKLPPTDSAMIVVLRNVWDIDAFVKTIRHEQPAGDRTEPAEGERK